MLSHLNRHVCNLKIQIKTQYELEALLALSVSEIRYKLLKKRFLSSLDQERIISFNTKNKKLKGLMSKNKSAESNYSTPLINLSYIELTSDETNQFKLGLEYSFIDKNKHIKKNLHANVESLADKVTENLENGKREGFHELLRAYVDIFTKNIHATRDNTYKNLKRIINDTNIAVVSGYKESCVVIMNRSDYFKKLKLMIDESVHNLVYIVTKDRTLKDLKLFCRFLYHNFKKYEHDEKMLPTSNQPEQLYGTAKTQVLQHCRYTLFL